VRRHLLVAGFGAIALLISSFAASSADAQVRSGARTTAAAAAAQAVDPANPQYTVTGPTNAVERTAVARTGAAIDEVTADGVVVTATRSEVRAISRLGYTVEPLEAGPTTQVLPPGFGGYHDFAELNTFVNQLVADHPTIARRQVVGQSFQGRDILAVKISDNVATDEAEPEVLFTHSQHAREILTVEMAVYIMNLLTDGYGSDSRITNLVNGREIWIMPNVNPDGTEYDKTSTGFRSWRKNRQTNPGSSSIGTDLNRNWNYQWGCCGGSSGSTSSETYRGSAPESATEVQVMANFVRSRVIGGQQQITAHIDWHTYGELILWPYGYTFNDTAPGLNATDRSAFATLGQAMAATNGYTPQQASDLYITDGSIDDWMWGVHRIFSYTFEMFPVGSPGFYPGEGSIAAQTSRNREAVLLFLDYADCPYRIIGVTCGGPAPTTVYSDNFETATGWTANPNGTDAATSGAFQRGDPAATSSGVALQLGTTTSGTNDLVTGATAGSSAGANDVDGGVTSIRSPSITLPSTGTLTLTAQWYLAHLNNSSNTDFFRISIVTSSGTTQVFQQLGAATNRAGSWATATANLTPFAGQSVQILVQASDAGTASLVEAAVDDVRITQT
jgi:carboxypeptidase T